MGLLIRIIWILLIFLLLRYILRSIFSSRPATPSSAPPNPDHVFSGRNVRQGRMEKDPICGTYVDVASSLSVKRGSQTHYFCSSECLEKFKRNN